MIDQFVIKNLADQVKFDLLSNQMYRPLRLYVFQRLCNAVREYAMCCYGKKKALIEEEKKNIQYCLV